MPGMATVSQRTIVAHAPEHAVATGARQGGTRADFVKQSRIDETALGNPALMVEVAQICHFSLLLRTCAVDRCMKGPRQFFRRRDRIGSRRGQCAARHRRRFAFIGVLNDAVAAPCANRRQAGRAVIEVAAEHHADRTGAIFACGGAKQRVGGRAGEVLGGRIEQPQVAAAHDHVPVGRRHVNSARLRRFPV